MALALALLTEVAVVVEEGVEEEGWRWRWCMWWGKGEGVLSASRFSHWFCGEEPTTAAHALPGASVGPRTHTTVEGLKAGLHRGLQSDQSPGATHIHPDGVVVEVVRGGGSVRTVRSEGVVLCMIPLQGPDGRS